MKILLTGDKGFIGSRVASVFKLNIPEAEYFYLRRNSNNINANELTLENVNTVKFDLIINCAGKNGNKESVYENNLLFVVKLLESVKTNNNFLLIHLSSYGIYNSITDKEVELMQQSVKTLDNYENSKYLCDQYISNKNFNHLIIYPSNVLKMNNFKLKIANSIFSKIFDLNINCITPDVLSQRIFNEYTDVKNLNDEKIRRKIYISEAKTYKSILSINLGGSLFHKKLLRYVPVLVKYYLFYFDDRFFVNEK